MLAELVKRRTQQFTTVAWQDFVLSPPGQSSLTPDMLKLPANELRVLSSGILLEGRDAWKFLIHEYHDLKSFRWIAEKLGFEEQAPTIMQKSGKIIRRICHSCSSRPWRRQ